MEAPLQAFKASDVVFRSGDQEDNVYSWRLPCGIEETNEVHLTLCELEMGKVIN